MQCTVLTDGALSNCSVLDETPPDLGFGEAALRGARVARIRLPDGQQFERESLIRFGVGFEMPEPEPVLTLLEDPDWDRPLRPAFPRSAERAGITTASVRLDCRAIQWTLRLNNCRVVEESHPGHRFGEAALRTARGARLSPRRFYNLGPETRVVFTMQFRNDDAR